MLSLRLQLLILVLLQGLQQYLRHPLSKKGGQLQHHQQPHKLK
jgi:hypothetical protein